MAPTRALRQKAAMDGVAASAADADRKTAAGGTHARRSAATRAKLIAAAIKVLQREGYAGTTTINVAREAGVSRGAMLHQFPTRVDLIIAVARHIVQTQDDERRRILRGHPRGLERLEAITPVAWETMLHPESLALVEIMLGSRSDAELNDRFPAVVRDLEAKLIAGPQEVARDVGITDMRLVEAMTRLHMAAMRGLIIERLFDADTRPVDDAIALLMWYKEQITRRLLADGSTDTPT